MMIENSRRVSVIVPVFGVEQYIGRCVRSLFEQSLDNVEFIFIDDCTPDKSIEVLNRIIAEYHSKISNYNWDIKVYKMSQNSGLPVVRQFGISLATGKYIIHCDSDDWVDPDFLTKLYEKAEDDRAEMVVCDYEMTDGTDSIVVHSYVEDNAHMIGNFILRRNKCCVWNKLIRHDLYDNEGLIYPKANMGEDLALTLQLVINCKAISYIQEPLYKYFKNMDSISNKPSSSSVLARWRQQYENVRLVEEVYKGKGLYDIYKDEFVSLKFYTKKQIEPIISQDNYFELWKDTFSEINYLIFSNKYIALKDKIRYLLIRLKLYR